MSADLWSEIEPSLPSSDGSAAAPSVAAARLWKVSFTDSAGRDRPAVFCPWQMVWKRQRRFPSDRAWDRIRSPAKLLVVAAWLVNMASIEVRSAVPGTAA